MILEHHSQASRALPSNGLIPIRSVSSLTGVNPVTLRAWERRYGLIKPVRTPKGHRLYTMADVERINQVLALLDAGMAISQVGQVLAKGPVTVAPEDQEEFDPWGDYQRRLMQAISDFNDRALNDIYNEALALYPVDIVTSRMIVPLLRELGWRWERGQEGGVAEEHFFSMFLRNKLGARFHHLNRELPGPRLLVSCLPEERHEVGALLFALAALDRGYPIVLLGGDTPLSELPIARQRTQAQAIVLSGSALTPERVVRTELPLLVQRVQEPVFVGGRITRRYPEELAAAGVILLGDDFNLALRKIAQVLEGVPDEERQLSA